jgi:hypothetical protein
MRQEKNSKKSRLVFSTNQKFTTCNLVANIIASPSCFTDRRVRDINVTSSSVCLSICLLCNKYVWSVCMSVCPSVYVVIKIEICIRLIFSRNKHILDGFRDSHQKKNLKRGRFKKQRRKTYSGLLEGLLVALKS